MATRRITQTELYELAEKQGFLIQQLAEKQEFLIQHDCSGYRVTTEDHSNVFPDSGICPTASRKECYAFLLGIKYARINRRGE